MGHGSSAAVRAGSLSLCRVRVDGWKSGTALVYRAVVMSSNQSRTTLNKHPLSFLRMFPSPVAALRSLLILEREGQQQRHPAPGPFSRTKMKTKTH